MAVCRDCEKYITWAENPNGKNLPFDSQPVKTSQHRLYTIVKGKAKWATDEDRRLHREMYTCHFDTCQGR